MERRQRQWCVHHTLPVRHTCLCLCSGGTGTLYLCVVGQGFGWSATSESRKGEKKGKGGAQCVAEGYACRRMQPVSACDKRAVGGAASASAGMAAGARICPFGVCMPHQRRMYAVFTAASAGGCPKPAPSRAVYPCIGISLVPLPQCSCCMLGCASAAAGALAPVGVLMHSVLWACGACVAQQACAVAGCSC